MPNLVTARRGTDLAQVVSRRPVCCTEVGFIVKLMTGLVDDTFRFIRIGEYDDDIEGRGYFWENPFGMEVERPIASSAAVWLVPMSAKFDNSL